jgi:hypothetical protein
VPGAFYPGRALVNKDNNKYQLICLIIMLSKLSMMYERRIALSGM